MRANELSGNSLGRARGTTNQTTKTDPKADRSESSTNIEGIAITPRSPDQARARRDAVMLGEHSLPPALLTNEQSESISLHLPDNDSFDAATTATMAAIELATDEVLPNYSKMTDFDMTEAKRSVSVDIFPPLAPNLTSMECSDSINNLQLSSLAYSGLNGIKTFPEGYSIAATDDLPHELRATYDGDNGLLTGGKQRLKAFIAKKDNELYVAFAGTEPGGATGRKGSVKTNYVQLRGKRPSSLYRRAVGLVRILLTQTDKKMHLTGHSLGGGLAQFAAIANIRGNEDRLKVQTFNSAGLSRSTLAVLGNERITAAKDKITHVRVKGDPVSPGSADGTKRKGDLVGYKLTILNSQSKGGMITAHFGSTILKALHYLKENPTVTGPKV